MIAADPPQSVFNRLMRQGWKPGREDLEETWLIIGRGTPAGFWPGWLRG
jgi:hypothetical protein